MSDDDADRPIACTLSEQRRADRTDHVTDTLVPLYDRAIEHADGYTLVFDGIDPTLSAVASFVAAEARCCSFAAFTVAVEPPFDETRLRITAPEGTKETFRTALIDRLETASS